MGPSSIFAGLVLAIGTLTAAERAAPPDNNLCTVTLQELDLVYLQNSRSTGCIDAMEHCESKLPGDDENSPRSKCYEYVCRDRDCPNQVAKSDAEKTTVRISTTSEVLLISILPFPPFPEPDITSKWIGPIMTPLVNPVRPTESPVTNAEGLAHVEAKCGRCSELVFDNCGKGKQSLRCVRDVCVRESKHCKGCGNLCRGTSAEDNVEHAEKSDAEIVEPCVICRRKLMTSCRKDGVACERDVCKKEPFCKGCRHCVFE